MSWGISNRQVKDKMNPPRVLRIREWSGGLTHKEHLQRHISSNRYDIWAANKLMIGLATRYNIYLKYLMIYARLIKGFQASNSSTLLDFEAAITLVGTHLKDMILALNPSL